MSQGAVAMSAEAKTDPFAALGDEHRRTIVQMLAERERQVGERS